jgi:mannose-6-phosphate isomerase-like protein (cupin superfamily)
MNKVIDKKTSAHYVWGNNCDSWVLAKTNMLSVKQENMPAGTKEKLHFHKNAQQFFFVLNGSATFYVDEKKAILNEQQGLLIDKNSNHYIANESSEPLQFLVISQPSTDNDRVNAAE